MTNNHQRGVNVTPNDDGGTDTQASAGRANARDWSTFHENILRTLAAEGPLYGLAIKRELEDYYDDDVNHGRLYPNLDELVESGLVAKSELDKRTNEYELTERGREEFRERVDFLDVQLTQRAVADGGSRE